MWYNKVWTYYDEDLIVTEHIKGKLKSAYQNYNTENQDINEEIESMIAGHPPSTNYTGDFKETLDYIFHS